MRGHGRGWVLIAAAFASGAAGCMSSTADPTGVSTRRPGQALRAAAAPVPPGQEIEVLDPNVDPTGKPAAKVTSFAPPPVPDGCLPFPPLPAALPQQQLDVPPAVLVHKFYYTGNRSFQAQMLPGGPLIVSVNHPKTLERVYVPVTLPPGAPRVTYTDDAIRYDYGPQSVSLIFGHCGNPRVKYSQSTNASENARVRIETTKAETRTFVERTGIPTGMQRFRDTSKQTLGAVADRVHDAGTFVADAFRAAVQFIPGSQLLTSSPEEAAARAQERAQRAAENRPNLDNTFVPRGP